MKKLAVNWTMYVYVLLAMCIGTNIFLFGRTLFARPNVEKSAVFFRDPGYTDANMPPDGYDAQGTPAEISPGTKGWIIRYASPDCKACRADMALWLSLKQELIAKGYGIYIVPPGLAAAYPVTSPDARDAVQIVYPNVAWTKRYRLVSTPTTLLFNRRGVLIWSHLGQMAQEDRRSALFAALWGR